MNILKMFESSNLFKIAFSESFEGALTTKESLGSTHLLIEMMYLEFYVYFLSYMDVQVPRLGYLCSASI